MADKKTKSAKPNFFVRFGQGFRRLLCKRIGNWRSKTCGMSCSKVTWPTREKLVNYSVIVVLFMLFMMIIIGLLDIGATLVG